MVLYCGGPRQAGFCPCTLRRSSDPPEPTFGRSRYPFGSVAPHPNCPPTAVPPKRLALQLEMGGVSSTAPRPPERPLRSLPPTLRTPSCKATAGCSKAPQGLRFPTGVPRLFGWDVGFAGFQQGTVGGSLIRSCKPPIKRQGITLP